MVLSKHPATHAYSALSKLVRYPFKKEDNRANLTCYSEHPAGNQYDFVPLTILYRPTVNVVRERYSVMEGNELSIPCVSDANPPGTVSWKRIRSSSPAPSVSRTDSATLLYERVPRELDGAVFECKAHNDFGDSDPVTVHIDVLCKFLLQLFISCQVLASHHFILLLFSRLNLYLIPF